MRWRVAVIGVVAALGLGLTRATAQNVTGAYYDAFPVEERMAIQLALIWTGDYAGMMDADFGPGTMGGIRAFQARTGFPVDGALSEYEARVLLLAAERAMAAVGFDFFDDPATGARIWLPLGLVRYMGPTDAGSRFMSPDGDIIVFTRRALGLNLAELYDQFRFDPASTVTYQAWGGSWFIVAGFDGGDDFYIRVETDGREVRGFSLFYERWMAHRMAPVTVAMSNLYVPFFSAPSAPATPAPAAAPVAQGPTTYYGTGFVIAADGTILTNAHVVEGCTVVTVGDWGTSSRIARDETNDLALIRPNGWSGTPLALATLSPRLGEPILVFGYPLAEILAQSLNVTQGIVSSMVGPGNDSRLMQISAGVNPGNSGGPLLNDAGQVVGVVSARLNDRAVLEAAGALPAAVAFAVRREVILAFLASQGILPVYDGRPERVPSTADIAARVAPSVVPLSCVSTQ